MAYLVVWKHIAHQERLCRLVGYFCCLEAYCPSRTFVWEPIAHKERLSGSIVPIKTNIVYQEGGSLVSPLLPTCRRQPRGSNMSIVRRADTYPNSLPSLSCPTGAAFGGMELSILLKEGVGPPRSYHERLYG